MDRISISELDNFIGVYFGHDYVMVEPGHEIEPKIQAYIHDMPDANLHALLADIELFLDECDDTEPDFRAHYKGEFAPANWDTTAQAFLARVQERVSAALKNRER
ncbi:hypothetical protein GKC49_01075 [Pantoea agglomerans]|uniref:CdiI immunity protein domain-containing protein n=1 Tax=Enterobacter agglomerans TaxID=549 RepID=A0A7X2MII3_ENTAG|nr:hypothetical protein [Pantoea agglomerans]